VFADSLGNRPAVRSHWPTTSLLPAYFVYPGYTNLTFRKPLTIKPITVPHEVEAHMLPIASAVAVVAKTVASVLLLSLLSAMLQIT